MVETRDDVVLSSLCGIRILINKFEENFNINKFKKCKVCEKYKVHYFKDHT